MTERTTPTIYLFDVDGTLMTFHGAGRRAYRKAFDSLIGTSDGLLDFSFAGLTDMGLVRKALERSPEEATTPKINDILDLYADHLPEAIRQTDFETHPGVHETLQFVQDFDDVAVGLGTGNIERGARLKLSHADPELNAFFDFGGFGSDAEQRDELLAAGARRGAERLGRSVSECRVMVIGDTPLDVHAARSIGAIAIGVTSGGATREQIAESSPDHIFEHLGDSGIRDVLRP